MFQYRFSKTKRPSQRTPRRRLRLCPCRRLMIESMEERAMLSAAPWSYDGETLAYLGALSYSGTGDQLNVYVQSADYDAACSALQAVGYDPAESSENLLDVGQALHADEGESEFDGNLITFASEILAIELDVDSLFLTCSSVSQVTVVHPDGTVVGGGSGGLPGDTPGEMISPSPNDREDGGMVDLTGLVNLGRSLSNGQSGIACRAISPQATLTTLEKTDGNSVLPQRVRVDATAARALCFELAGTAVSSTAASNVLSKDLSRFDRHNWAISSFKQLEALPLNVELDRADRTFTRSMESKIPVFSEADSNVPSSNPTPLSDAPDVSADPHAYAPVRRESLDVAGWQATTLFDDSKMTEYIENATAASVEQRDAVLAEWPNSRANELEALSTLPIVDHRHIRKAHPVDIVALVGSAYAYLQSSRKRTEPDECSENPLPQRKQLPLPGRVPVA